MPMVTLTGNCLEDNRSKKDCIGYFLNCIYMSELSEYNINSNKASFIRIHTYQRLYRD